MHSEVVITHSYLHEISYSVAFEPVDRTFFTGYRYDSVCETAFNMYTQQSLDNSWFNFAWWPDAFILPLNGHNPTSWFLTGTSRNEYLILHYVGHQLNMPKNEVLRKVDDSINNQLPSFHNRRPSLQSCCHLYKERQLSYCPYKWIMKTQHLKCIS